MPFQYNGKSPPEMCIFHTAYAYPSHIPKFSIGEVFFQFKPKIMYLFILAIWNQSKKTNEDYATDEKLPGNFNRDTLL